MQQPSVEFNGIPWPPDTPSYPAESVVKGFNKTGKYQSMIDAIQGSGADKVYIVGHSSGCAIANAVDKGLEYTEDIVLVALDGFTPDDDQLDRPSTQVWGAMCGDQPSKNFPGPSKGRRKVYPATDCKKLLALHFSLVNAAASDATVHDVASGYFKCKANLAWL